MSIQLDHTWYQAYRSVLKMSALLLPIIEQILLFLSAIGNIKMDKKPLLPSDTV